LNDSVFVWHLFFLPVCHYPIRSRLAVSGKT
jgi:hypothetical protein